MKTLVLIILMAWAGAAESATSVGREGRVSVVLPVEGLQAVPVQDRADLVLHVVDRQAVPEGVRYDLRWIGTVPGSYDLARLLIDVDGRPVAGLPAIPVQVVAVLPPGMPDGLERVPTPAMEPFGGYRVILLVLGCLWLAVLPLLWKRRRRPAPPVATPPPDLRALLRTLVGQARSQGLDAPALAQLERLLLGHWRERLDLAGLDTTQALERLRAHPEAGALLRQLDAWLHARPGSAEVDVEALLAPYAGGRP